MKRIMTMAAAMILASGCTMLDIENVTKEGRTFHAHAYSFLWDRNLEGLQFNYEKGTLDVINLSSTPDKVTIGKGIDTIARGLELMKKGL